MAVPKTTDFLVIGGGVMGLTVTLELKRRHPDLEVVLLEKEENLGLHASGRNSGVLHAGFYYTANSFKARFTREGNRRLTEYCLHRGLPINRCGKLVVAKTEQELEGLDTLLERGRNNGVDLQEVSEEEASDIEPHVQTVGRALYSPSTSTVDPRTIIKALMEDAQAAGVRLKTGVAYLGKYGNAIQTSRGQIQAGYTVNTAGLYADRIARDFGFSQNYRILPFKGLYVYSNKPDCPLRTHIYPVPDLKNPFLGVHFTVTVNNQVKIGPTAIPAFWRENYTGLGNFSFNEFLEILLLEAELFARNRFGFRRLAFTEMQKYYTPRMVSMAQNMVHGLDMNAFRKPGKPGVRAQPVNLEERKLEMDFLYEGDKASFHLINAVSPAFTCSFPFSEFLVDRIQEMFSDAAKSPEEKIRNESI